MYSNNIIMSIKNVFITSGMTFLFGVYSLYNILDYLNNIDRIYIHKLLDLQRKLDETDKHYNNLYVDFIKIKNEVEFLSSQIVIIEKKLTERPLYCFSPNFDYYESSEDDKNSNESKNTIRITSENNNSESNIILLIETVDKNIDDKNIDDKNIDDKNIDDKNIDDKNIDKNIDDKNVDDNKIMEYDCVEMVNIADINTIQVSDCSSRKNSLTNSKFKKEPLYKSKSAYLSDVNWTGLMKTFLLG
jgi:hypothetical protein